ncbi:MAG: hypothetical protein ACYC7D_14905 [Nitrososphaerales archaeon]
MPLSASKVSSNTTESYGSVSRRSGISKLFLVIIILTVTLTFFVGTYFLIAKTPPVAPGISTTTTITTTTSLPGTYSLISGSTVTLTRTSGFSSTFSVTSQSTTTVTKNVTRTVSETFSTNSSQSIVREISVSGNISASGNGAHASSMSFLERNGSVFAANVNDGHYSIELPNYANYSVTIGWSGAYYWQGGTQSFNFTTDSTSSLFVNWNLVTPSSQVSLSGGIAASGSGTRASEVTFVSSHNVNYSESVLNGEYNVSLPNLDSYAVYASWSGAYLWQSGSASLGSIQVNDFFIHNWTLETPASEILVSGKVNTTGSGSSANALTFSGNKGSIMNVVASDGEYSVTLPNSETYDVSVGWSGSYSWQRGSIAMSLSLYEGLGITSLVSNFENVPTPNSNVVVSGSVSTTGTGTSFTGITFYSPIAGSYSTASYGSLDYYVTLPNLANYTVGVNWSGQYSWQKGIANTGQFILAQYSSSSVSKNWIDVQTPNSNITVSGSINPSGSGTSIASLEFSSTNGVYPANLSGGYYSASLPNLVNYSLAAKWVGEYSWQNGTSVFPLGLYAGSGVSTFTANWNIPTPNSIISLSGTISSLQGRTPYEVRFVSSNGAINLTASVSGGTFTIALPNYVDYTVIIYYSSNGVNGEANVGGFDLYATPGVSAIYTNWSI